MRAAVLLLVLLLPAIALGDDDKPREIVRGVYAKVEGGLIAWLPPMTSAVADRGGQLVLVGGGDVVATTRFSLSIEGRFVHRTTGLGEAAPPFHVTGGMAGVRLGPHVGPKHAPRLSIAAHVAGGAGASAWFRPAGPAGSDLASKPAGPVGLVRVGVGAEYFTLLAHLSVGFDLAYDLVVGDHVGSAIGVTGFAKYTF